MAPHGKIIALLNAESEDDDERSEVEMPWAQCVREEEDGTGGKGNVQSEIRLVEQGQLSSAGQGRGEE